MIMYARLPIRGDIIQEEVFKGGKTKRVNMWSV